MGLPKRRTSRARKLKRRAQWKLKAPTLSTCRTCGTPKMQHRVCSNCGSYAGREVVTAPES
jgi:large subunit ribosomal protein L32